MLCVTLTIRRIIEHIVYSNLLVSLSCGIMTAGFSHYIGAVEWLSYGTIALLTTFAIYNFQRLVKSAESILESRHMLWVEAHRTSIIVLMILTSITDGILLLKVLNWSIYTLILGGIGLLISFFYIVRIGKSNLRELPYTKIHLIVISWVYMVGIFPLLNEQIFTFNLWIMAFIQYFYLIGVTIPFDIRDLPFDNPKQRTIPQVFGVKGSKLIGFISLILFYCFVIMLEHSFLTNLLFLLAIVVQILLVIRTQEKQPEFYSSGLIEGLIMLLGLAYFFS